MYPAAIVKAGRNQSAAQAFWNSSGRKRTLSSANTDLSIYDMDMLIHLNDWFPVWLSLQQRLAPIIVTIASCQWLACWQGRGSGGVICWNRDHTAAGTTPSVVGYVLLVRSVSMALWDGFCPNSAIRWFSPGEPWSWRPRWCPFPSCTKAPGRPSPVSIPIWKKRPEPWERGNCEYFLPLPSLWPSPASCRGSCWPLPEPWGSSAPP